MLSKLAALKNKASLMSLTAATAVMANPLFASASGTVKSMNKNIYSKGADNIIATKIEQIVKIVGGLGGAAFTLAILIITLVIIFGSISAQKMRTVWMSLISCIAGALIFFSAYMLAPAIAQLAG